MEWQPIETAPKDGTRVFLTNGQFTELAEWKEEAGYGAGERPRPGWSIFECEDPWFSYSFESPTHWMPMPEPPDTKHTDQTQ